MSAPILEVNAVDKFYGPVGQGVHAVQNFTMHVEKGEIVALLGSSGCGKTSTLRMIAGFEEVSRGAIRLAGREVHMLAPAQRNVAMAFEGYSLYPPLTVRENIAFALKASKLQAGEVKRRVAEIAALLEIESILERYPSSISGGQQQRASLGRALIRDAHLHLLDEPMGQLEPQLRSVLRGRIKHFIKERGLTAILVTHDQTEANALSDRIAVMEGGLMQQFDKPAAIKDRPANLFTGTFVGEPPMNVFAVKVEAAGAKLNLVMKNGTVLAYGKKSFSAKVSEAVLACGSIAVGIRPYAARRAKSGPSAVVIANQWLGDQTHIAANLGDESLVLVEHDRARLSRGDVIHVELAPDALHFFDVETGAAISHGRELAG
jgi:multiple sugar transport system ATP-binding protein